MNIFLKSNDEKSVGVMRKLIVTALLKLVYITGKIAETVMENMGKKAVDVAREFNTERKTTRHVGWSCLAAAFKPKE